MEEPVVEEEGTFALEPLRFYAESLDLSCLRHVTKPIVDVSQMVCRWYIFFLFTFLLELVFM